MDFHRCLSNATVPIKSQSKLQRSLLPYQIFLIPSGCAVNGVTYGCRLSHCTQYVCRWYHPYSMYVCYLAYVGNVSGDVLHSHWVLYSQSVTLTLHACHVHKYTCICRQSCSVAQATVIHVNQEKCVHVCSPLKIEITYNWGHTFISHDSVGGCTCTSSRPPHMAGTSCQTLKNPFCNVESLWYNIIRNEAEPLDVV